MNENNPNTDKNQVPNPQQPFDYEAHYRQQNQQYQNPQQPNNAQYYQNSQQRPPVPPVPPVRPIYTQYGTSVDNAKAFSIMSYISILWLVGLLADKNNPKVRFHVNQGIILTIFEVAVNVLFSIIKSFISAIFIQSFSGVVVVSQLGVTLNGMLTLTAWCLYIAFMIIGILHAVQDREEPLPIIGTLFQVLK